MKQISRQLRKKIMERDCYRCAYCGLITNESDIHIDHIFPKSKGGKDHPLNLVTSCKSCNKRKSAKILDKPPKVIDIPIEQGDFNEIVGNRFQYPMWSNRLSKEVTTELRRRYGEGKDKDPEYSWNKLFEKLLDLKKK